MHRYISGSDQKRDEREPTTRVDLAPPFYLQEAGCRDEFRFVPSSGKDQHKARWTRIWTPGIPAKTNETPGNIANTVDGSPPPPEADYQGKNSCYGRQELISVLLLKVSSERIVYLIPEIIFRTSSCDLPDLNHQDFRSLSGQSPSHPEDKISGDTKG